MEMEDHHHQYAITDLRQLVNGPRSAHFPSIPPPQQPTAELFPNMTTAVHHHHHQQQQQQQYEMMMFGRQVPDIMPRCLHEFDAAAAANTSIAVATTPTTTTTTTTSASTPPLSGCIGGDASTGRWPRQETLTLLDIRSRLDLQFKEANQKGPLWDEVSRIMCEEHGFQRSGKKCREKFENLYKYYKKTKEGKAGRQDGKHYRFFRQLEALYGENCSNTGASAPEPSNSLRHHNNALNQENMLQSHSLSLTNSTDFETSSSDNEDDHHSTDEGNGMKDMNDSTEKNRRKRSWKAKIKEFIDLQMRKLVEKQEEWLDKLMRTLEQKEKERVLREEDWRRQEAARLEREHKFWAKERAWIEARDAALMEALQKLSGNNNNNIIINETGENRNEDGSEMQNIIAKKRKENSRSCFYFENNNNGQSSCLYNNNNNNNHQGGSGYCDINDQRQQQQQTNDGSSPSNSNVASAVVHGDTSCFPFLISTTEGGNLWDNYSLKVNKSNQNQ